jgi:hypothetical protein
VTLRPIPGASTAQARQADQPESVSTIQLDREQEKMSMSNADQESWSRVKERLRVEVGDDVYSSWFARMDLEAIDDDAVRLSVPTRFLKSWIQSHYAERVLACWQALGGAALGGGQAETRA